MGERVTDSGDGARIYAVADMTRMEVILGVNEVDILKVKRGMPAKLILDAVPDEEFTGKLRFVSPGIRKARRSLRQRSDEALVRIVVPLWGSEEESFNLARSVAERLVPALENALPG